MPEVGPTNLPAFVETVDALGGPGHPMVENYWRNFSYRPATHVDTSLDPFDDAYMAAQLALYHEISGRSLDQSANEHTVFDRQAHLAARNPYNHGEPGVLANQIVQLAKAFRLANPRRGARMIDMGCGWGLSSEIAAYCGLQVEAVDINPDFVALVRERSLRYRYDIKAVHAAFDTFETRDRADLILFYECLHHAVEPWSLLDRLAGMLDTSGKLVACGEPVNTNWWPHWGLRLDPMSVYCIHKHGWFESGWSQEFIVRCLDRALLDTDVVADPDPMIGTFLVASKNERLSASWLARNCAVSDGVVDGDYIVAGGNLMLGFTAPVRATANPALVLQNFAPQPIQIFMRRNGADSRTFDLAMGETQLPLGQIVAGDTLAFSAKTWVPAETIGNQDHRRLAFHIGGLAVQR